MSDYLWFEGIPFPEIGFEKEILEEIGDKFVVRDEDTFILTYPKSERSPWIETQSGHEILINKEGPRLASSHLPFHLFPKTFFSSKAKIYVIRNPRDVLVSGYFFLHKTNLAKTPDSLRTYFEWFLKGNVLYGSWFEHTRAWLSMRERDNFLLLSYEDMKQDTRGTIEKICDFLGKKLEKDELDLVLKYSSFQVMKENKMSNFSLVSEDMVTNGLHIMRKGEEKYI
ncbi:Sulfotransferase 2A1 [Lemmus lemmus]